MNKRDLWIYRISTGLVTLMMGFSVSMYLFKNEFIQEAFTNVGFPTWLIYPMATAKILGLVAIWTNRSKWLKEWAYAGFFFNFVLASAAHTMVGDGEQMGAIMATVLLIISYIFYRRLYQPYSA